MFTEAETNLAAMLKPISLQYRRFQEQY